MSTTSNGVSCIGVGALAVLDPRMVQHYSLHEQYNVQ